MSDLRQAILQTVAYFDLFDYPLTALEVWRFLYAPGMEPRDFETILAMLPALLAEQKLETKNGFYFFPGRAAIMETRAARYSFSFLKYRLARRAAKLFSYVPGVRLVALGNTMAWRHADKSSDIDFFIVTSAKKIWSTRLLSVLPISALGLRPRTGQERPNALCLSFFASEGALNLRSLMIRGDIYLPYWIASLVPLVGAPGVFEKFKEENAWIREYLPNVFFRDPAAGIKKPGFTYAIALPYFFEAVAKKIELNFFPESIRSRSGGVGTDVILSDNYLKFHTSDRRVELRDAWMAKIRNII